MSGNVSNKARFDHKMPELVLSNFFLFSHNQAQRTRFQNKYLETSAVYWGKKFWQLHFSRDEIHIYNFFLQNETTSWENIWRRTRKKIVFITLFCLYKLHKRSKTHNWSFTYPQNKNKSFQNIHFKKLQIFKSFQNISLTKFLKQFYHYKDDF